MTIAEHLNSAADRLESEETAATRGPWVYYVTQGRPDSDGAWTISRPYGRTCGDTGCEPDCAATVLVTGAEDCDEDHIGAADVVLIATLRGAAPALIGLLRHDARRAETQIDVSGLHLGHCGRPVGELREDRCQCFDAALALAASILGGN